MQGSPSFVMRVWGPPKAVKEALICMTNEKRAHNHEVEDASADCAPSKKPPRGKQQPTGAWGKLHADTRNRRFFLGVITRTPKSISLELLLDQVVKILVMRTGHVCMDRSCDYQ